MMKASDNQNGNIGLLIPPYAAYNIGNSSLENLLDFVHILSEELIRAKELSEDYNFKTRKGPVLIQSCDLPVAYTVKYNQQHKVSNSE